MKLTAEKKPSKAKKVAKLNKDTIDEQAHEMRKLKKEKKAKLETESKEEELAPEQEMDAAMEYEANEEEEDVENDDAVVTNGKGKANSKAKTPKVKEVKQEAKQKPRGKEYTIFVGNLPKTTKQKDLRAMFSKYGAIQTIRLRTNTGLKMFNKKVLSKVPSLNAYVVYDSKEEMEKACELDGEMMSNNRIRVCPADKKQIGDAKATVFVGNIARGTTDNDLHEFFSRVGPIEYVRQIGDKYVAYVCFKKGVSIMKALKLNQESLNGRLIRVEKVDTTRTNVKLNKKGHVVPRNRLPASPGANTAAAPAGEGKANSTGGGAGAKFHGKVAHAKAKKSNVSLKKGKGSVAQKKMLASKLKAAMKQK
ncbi:nucleolar protein 12-like [Anopheles merus]|uniref:RRM domain-containing protein n=1 Tax=Anopheles merus TaxID=30066 RepID=A0A182UYM0_ANOME|nr:nucleolar protein 12-like [Anopheles merus]